MKHKCRPGYVDPNCPLHHGEAIAHTDIRKAIEFFKKLEQDLAAIDYDPNSPRWHTEHLAMKYGKILWHACVRCNEMVLHSDDEEIEKMVLDLIREQPDRLTPKDILEKIDEQDAAISRVIKSLSDRGVLGISPTLKLAIVVNKQ